MRQCMDAENLHRRLKKILGQVQAIDRMIDEDVPCEDVLAQINAAKSALHGCGRVVLEGHIKHCVRDGFEHGDAARTIDSFTKAGARFAHMSYRHVGLADTPPDEMSGNLPLFFLAAAGFADRNRSISLAYQYPYGYHAYQTDTRAGISKRFSVSLNEVENAANHIGLQS